jgi:hypothetical protein
MSHEGLKLNGTHQLLVYAELLYWEKNMNTINKNREARLQAGRKVGPEYAQKKPSIWLCLVTKLLDKITIY